MTFTLRLLGVTLLLLLSALPCRAELVFGVVQGQETLFRNDTQVNEFASYLGRNLSTEVAVRRFTDAESLWEWLATYREVDLAFLPADSLAIQPRLQALPLAQFGQPGETATSYVLVMRQGLPPALQQQLTTLAERLPDDPDAPPFIRTLSQAGAGTAARPVEATANSYQEWLTTQSFSGSAPATSSPAPKTAQNPLPPPAVVAPAGKPAATPGAVPPPPPEADALTPTERQAKAPAISAPSAAKTEQDALTAAERRATAATQMDPRAPQAPVSSVARPGSAGETPSPPAKTLVGTAAPPALPPTVEASAPTPTASADTPPATGENVSGPAAALPSKQPGKLPWTAILVLGGLAVLLGGAFLLRQERRHQRKLSELVTSVTRRADQEQPAPPRTAAKATPPLAPAPLPSAPAPARPSVRAKASDKAKSDQPAKPGPASGTAPPSSGPLKLQGELDAIQVPLLLQMLATHSQPGTLVIHGRHSEKRIHFREGLISSAVSLNRVKQSTSGFLMNKLGYLLIRQGKISETERDRALEFCETHPRTRIGEALIEIGAIDRTALQEALRNQAEGVIFSLFIFAEGYFEFIPGDEKLARNDHLDIRIVDLLKEAVRHEGEWAKIRRAIPTLDTVLEFAPGGREKAKSARMTVHQKLVLSLVDGFRSIHDICTEATMLDFEVYNFLYLMVRASILQLATAGEETEKREA